MCMRIGAASFRAVIINGAELPFQVSTGHFFQIKLIIKFIFFHIFPDIILFRNMLHLSKVFNFLILQAGTQ